jgi:uncharacterized membrane protein
MIAVVILGILLGTFLVLSAIDRLWRPVATKTRGRISLAAVFAFTAVGHFLLTDKMAAMLPEWVPLRTAIVSGTGVLEFAGAAGLLIPRLSRTTGICFVAFLILVFPANVYAALQHVDIGGHAAGPVYLLIRLPLQLVLIAWAWWFAVRRRPVTP